MPEKTLFFILAAMSVIGALVTITRKNPLGGALALLERLVCSESGAACRQSLTFAAAPAANLVLEF